MNEKDIASIITLVRRAPLHNMDEAEAAAALLQRFVKHFQPEPEEGDDV